MQVSEGSGRVQQGSGRLRRSARWKLQVQVPESSGQFRTVPEGSRSGASGFPPKVPDKVPGGLGVQQGSKQVPEEVWEALVQLKCFQRLASQHASF